MAPTTPLAAPRVWALLLGSSVLYFFTTNEADNDLWGHVLAGRDILAAGAVPRLDTYSYTAAGSAWVDHEWLAQVIMAGAYAAGGSPGLLLLKFILAVATCGLLFAMVRRRTARPEIWGGLGLLTIAVLARGFAVRPQIFTYGLVALTLWLIDRSRARPRILWAFPVLFLVWANVHGGFVVGLAILGLFVAAESLRRRAVAAQPALVLVAAAAATTLNPYGVRLPLYIWNELSRPHPITEWQPVAVADVEHFVFFAMAALFVVTLPFFRSWRTDAWQPVLALMTGVLALRAQRHTPVFALCAVTPLAAQLDEAVRWFRQRSAFSLSPVAQRAIVLALVVVATAQLTLTGLRWRRDGLRIVFDPADYPIAAVQALHRSGVPANLIVPLDWGAYVLWHLAPTVKVSLDGRFATVFPDDVVAANVGFFSGAAAGRRLLEHHPSDAALVPAGVSLPLLREAGWARVYADDVAEVYARPDRSVLLRLTREPTDAAGVFP